MNRSFSFEHQFGRCQDGFCLGVREAWVEGKRERLLKNPIRLGEAGLPKIPMQWLVDRATTGNAEFFKLIQIVLNAPLHLNHIPIVAVTTVRKFYGSLDG